ncbi:MAG: protein-glutamate O-methyltransferase CheR [Candidatus Poribacteria bacterium]
MAAERIGRVLRDRSTAAGTRDAQTYVDMLSDPSEAGRGEWDALAATLTVGETFFFRDRDLFEALRTAVLPDVLSRRDGPIRVWSAGCSDGQEIYSVAMLLQDVGELGGREHYLLGTDVNPAAIARARRGRYPPWSFRGVDPSIMARHFASVGADHQLSEPVRRAVTTQVHNLLGDTYPGQLGGPDAMDIILCRNVLIYFDEDAVVETARRLVQSLRPGGYLVLGNAEVHSGQLSEVVARTMGGRVVYQRVAGEAARPHVGARRAAPGGKASAPQGSPAEGSGARDDGPPLDAAEALLAQGDSAGAARLAQEVVERVGGEVPRAWLVIARARADQGQHAPARAAVAAVLDADPLSWEGRLILARIADEVGDNSEAKKQFRKVIYLHPTHVDAYLSLASLCERGGEGRQAARAYRGALDVLKSAPHDGDGGDDLVASIAARMGKLNAEA